MKPFFISILSLVLAVSFSKPDYNCVICPINYVITSIIRDNETLLVDYRNGYPTYFRLRFVAKPIYRNTGISGH